MCIRDRIDTKQKKEYTSKNKEKVLENKRQYYENNKEIISEKKKIYWENNKDYFKKTSKEYREVNKAKLKEQKNEYVQTYDGAITILVNKRVQYNKKYGKDCDIDVEYIKQLIIKQNSKCVYCQHILEIK